MEEESQIKMEALKKAYAEIILNSSKEAAARVMVAERKAECYQHDFVSLRDESVRLLVRLKENFDSKIAEAEARSLNQQVKIEELEAQLCEAEGIIVDLRYELKQVQEELDIKRHNQKKPLDGHILGVDEPVRECGPQDNAHDPSSIMVSVVSEAKSIPLDSEMRATDKKCFHAMNITDMSAKTHVDQFQAGSDDCTSIILQNREGDLYRNGCPQRIHAFERNLSDVRLSTSTAEYNPYLVNVQPDIHGEEADNGSQYPVTASAHITSKPTLFSERKDSAHQDHLTNIRTMQNRYKKCKKPRGKLKKACLRTLNMSDEASNAASCCGSHLKMVDGNVKSCEELCAACSSKTKKVVKKTPNGLGQFLLDCSCYKGQATRSLRRSARKNARYREAIASLRRPYRKASKSLKQPFLCQCKGHVSGVKVPSVEVPIEVVEREPKKTKVCYASESDNLSPSSEIKPSHNDVIPGNWFDKIVCADQGDGVVTRLANTDKLCHRPVPVDVQLADSELVDIPISEGFGSPHFTNENKRPLKFTFQRKNRKNVLSKVDENIVPDRTTARTLEKPVNVTMLYNHGSKNELHRDS